MTLLKQGPVSPLGRASPAVMMAAGSSPCWRLAPSQAGREAGRHMPTTVRIKIADNALLYGAEEDSLLGFSFALPVWCVCVCI